MTSTMFTVCYLAFLLISYSWHSFESIIPCGVLPYKSKEVIRRFCQFIAVQLTFTGAHHAALLEIIDARDFFGAEMIMILRSHAT